MRISYTILLSSFLLIFALSLSSGANAFSNKKKIDPFALVKLNKAREFLKLNFEDFRSITGKKNNPWNRASFAVFKMNLKHEVKKNPELKMSDYLHAKHKMPVALRIISLVILVALVLMLVIALIYSGTGPRR